MKYSFIVIVFALLINSCNQNPKQGALKKAFNQNSDSISLMSSEALQPIDSSQSITIVDSSNYSSTFIKTIKTDTEYRKLYFNKNFIIINFKDTVYFPEDPLMGKELHFSNIKGKVKIDLTIKRILLSTIEYKIELNDNERPVIIKSGIANLSPYFFIGPEQDSDDSTNYAYDSIEYWDPKDNFQTAIRIGVHKELKNLYLAKIIYKMGATQFDLDNFPTLFEKK